MEEIGKNESEPLSFGEAPLPITWDEEGMTPVEEPAEETPEEVGSKEMVLEELSTEVQPVDETPAAPLVITGADELPSVITADMLRARRAQRKAADFASEAFQIPEELLVGIEESPVAIEEELEEEIFESRGKPRGKGKPEKGKGKKVAPVSKPEKGKGKKARRWQGGDDDLGDF
jgi:hypothetical protein